MAKTIPFDDVVNKIELSKDEQMNALLAELSEKILLKQDRLIGWLGKYVPLAYETKDDPTVKSQPHSIADKLAKAGYRTGFENLYDSAPAGENLSSQAHADMALSRAVGALSSGKPIHPSYVMGHIEEYIAKRHEEGTFIRLER